MSAAHRLAGFAIEFARNLRLVPAECRRDLAAVYWVDHQRCVNWCWAEPLKARTWDDDSPLVRLFVNCQAPRAIEPYLPTMRHLPGWDYIDRGRPGWSRQVTCHRDEVEAIAQWLAEFVNRREGLQPMTLAPSVVVPMTTEDDESVTSGFYWTNQAYNTWRRLEAEQVNDQHSFPRRAINQIL